MAADIDEYKGTRLTVVNDGKRCIHSRHCVLNLPEVFKPNVEGRGSRPMRQRWKPRSR